MFMYYEKIIYIFDPKFVYFVLQSIHSHICRFYSSIKFFKIVAIYVFMTSFKFFSHHKRGECLLLKQNGEQHVILKVMDQVKCGKTALFLLNYLFFCVRVIFHVRLSVFCKLFLRC